MKTIVKLAQLSLLFSCSLAFGQGDIPVDMFTGTPAISIPLYTVSDHDLSETVGIVYSASGIKLQEQKGIAGLGWNLQAGGTVYRMVRGLPDDFQGPGENGTRTGWFYNSNATAAHNFSNAADLTTSCADNETTAHTSLKNNEYKADTEPDIFYYSAGGISGAFVFDKDLTIRLIPYRDVKIEYTTHSQTEKRITSFTITVNTGIKYKFDLPVPVTRSTHKLTGLAEVEFLKKEFEQYDVNIYNPGVSFNQEWKLTEVQSPSSATLTYTYHTGAMSSSADTVRVGIRKLTSSAVEDKPIFYLRNSMRPREIKSITSTTGEALIFEMHEVDRVIKKIKVVHKRRASPEVKEFQFAYQAPLDQDSTTSGFARIFLKSVTEVSSSQCEQIPPYTFAYVNVDFTNNICHLPSIASKAKDFWGYYNGKNDNTSFYPKLYIYPSEPLAERIRIYHKANHAGAEYILPGADRAPDAASMQIGSLKMITYPSGGATVINYEPHEFYDPAALQTFIGGGLRVKSIVTYDGVDAANSMIKNFEYKELSGTSSGSLINKPVFAIPMSEYQDPNGSTVKTYAQLASNTQSMYEHLIARINVDVNGDVENEVIGYNRVKVSRPGSGAAEFEYALPATYGATVSGEWTATENKFVRNSACPPMGVVSSGGLSTFPYASNPNFGYERGYLVKKIERNESGSKVRETTYTPQYIFKTGTQPSRVYGICYDYYPYSDGAITEPTFFFGKYYLLTDVAKVASLETTTTYDANDASKSVNTSLQFFYESSFHKLMTRTTSTLIDGTVVTRRIKYPLDFGSIPPVSELAPSPDTYLLGIKNLKDSSRNGVPIEEVTTVQRPGDAVKTTGAILTKFGDFGVPGRVLPEQYLSLKIEAGITDFTDAGKTVNGMVIEFTHDHRYEADRTFLAFDEYNLPLTTVGKDGIYQSTHWGFRKNVAVVQATNTRHDQFVFSNFETDSTLNTTGYEFMLTPHSVNPVSHTGLRSAYAGVKLSKTLQKAGVSNYKLAFWFKKQPSGNDFNIKLKNAAGTVTYYDNTFTVNPVSSGWEYFQRLVPVSAVSSTFTIELQAINIPSGSTPLIDDVAFCPENADLVSHTYDIPFGQTSITDATASVIYSAYDALGRHKLTLDQDKNIIRKKSYVFPGSQPPAFTASIAMNNKCAYGQCYPDYTTYTFSANDDNCITDGITYEWKFGNDNWAPGGKTASKTYNAPGTYTVYLKKHHVLYGTVQTSKTFTLEPKNLDGANMCAKGVATIQCMTVTDTYACAQIAETPDTNQTYFKVKDVLMNGSAYNDPNDPVMTYQWYQKPFGLETWNAVGTNQSTIVLSAGMGYDVKCLVTTQSGRTGWAGEMTVTKEICN